MSTAGERTVVMRLRAVAALCGVLAAWGGVAPPANALVPRAHRIIEAVADTNVSGHRVRALRFNVRMRIGEGPPVAVGELVTHPTGLARLELRASGGLVERHILLGDLHSAARNARLLVRPRAFLPPLFVLQSNSGMLLEAALVTLGVDRKLVGLAPCGDNDCYVIGDPARAVRRPLIAPEPEAIATTPPEVDQEVDHTTTTDTDFGTISIRPAEPHASDVPAERVAEEETAAVEEEEQEEADETAQAMPPTEFFAALWVDTVDHNVRRMESRNGVRVVLGPYVKFERLHVPMWWSIEEPGKRPVRFEVDGVVEVNAPAAAFSKAWLMAPVELPELPEEAAEEPGEAAPSTTPTTTPSTTSATPATIPATTPGTTP